ncbi:TetR/AcrR family transcriptional regulator [Microbacterium sp. 3J1]|uniref:TetR/AcrR family transcriptional regulator n=1 Tax=Microbacterium sp. 3J1 TaxID=861269 RepID=UPI000A824C8E|nr:TetR/AcrR family transcriptional regulator [Microbacterium sp. 3J1]
MKTASRAPAPRRLPPEQRERSILDGAIALAGESGLEALTVRAIAARVGVTPALVAHYRPVMDAFIAEVFSAIVAAERDEVIDAYDASIGLRDNLLRIIETLLDDSRDDVAMVWVQAWALGARNDALAAGVRAEMDLWQSGLEDLIARAITEDPSIRVDPGTSAWMLLAMVDGMSAHSLVKWAPRDRSDLARRTLAAVLDAPTDTRQGTSPALTGTDS